VLITSVLTAASCKDIFDWSAVHLYYLLSASWTE